MKKKTFSVYPDSLFPLHLCRRVERTKKIKEKRKKTRKAETVLEFYVGVGCYDALPMRFVSVQPLVEKASQILVYCYFLFLYICRFFLFPFVFNFVFRFAIAKRILPSARAKNGGVVNIAMLLNCVLAEARILHWQLKTVVQVDGLSENSRKCVVILR